MIAEELVNKMIPPLKGTDTAQKAITWMDEFRLSQMPVVDDMQYKGLVSEEMIMDCGSLEKYLSTFKLEAEDVFVQAGAHFYEVVKLAMKSKVQIIAVIDQQQKYVGVISVNETAAAIAHMFASQGPGGIMILSVKENDYSLSQISRLVESNDAKIISSFLITNEVNPAYIKITLKLNRTDLSRIIATFERYDYHILATFQEGELASSDKERLDLLLRYLNI